MKYFLFLFLAIFFLSCVDTTRDLSSGKGVSGNETKDTTSVDSKSIEESVYLYPFSKESPNNKAEITIYLSKPISLSTKDLSIPFLKYNKTWLMLFTQDDGLQHSYCRTWASINGRPVSNSDVFIQNGNSSSNKQLFYTYNQLNNDDLPPNVLARSHSLSTTDGTGHLVRFAITATITPEQDAKIKSKNYMWDEGVVSSKDKENYMRFLMKYLTWREGTEMLNYGTGIAFHNVGTPDANDVNGILAHYQSVQDSITNHFGGRKCKMIAEPDGNQNYLDAAYQYNVIKLFAAQNHGKILYPFATTDLTRFVVFRNFFDTTESVKSKIQAMLAKSLDEREAISIGIHGTDNSWRNLLQWIDSTYGARGDSSVWFPAQEEYYEYTYYRNHSLMNMTKVDDYTYKITINMQGEDNFYFPSITVNLSGISKDNIKSITTNDAITGFSYANHAKGIMMNVDCRKFLYDNAVHYVETYEKDPSKAWKKEDALYFTNMLKTSDQKTTLLKRIK